MLAIRAAAHKKHGDEGLMKAKRARREASRQAQRDALASFYKQRQDQREEEVELRCARHQAAGGEEGHALCIPD